MPPFPGRPGERPGTAEGRVSEAAAHLPLDGLELAAWEALITVLDRDA